MITTIAGWLLGTTAGRYVLIIGAAVVALGLAYLWIRHSAYEAGAASAIAAAAAESLRRTAKANAARAAVKPGDKAAMDADPMNRDNQR